MFLDALAWIGVGVVYFFFIYLGDRLFNNKRDWGENFNRKRKEK